MNLIRRFANFLKQPDAQSNLGRALIRRVTWRIYRMIFPQALYRYRNWYQNYHILVPNTGAAAQIYYRRFSDETTVRFLEAHVRQGDTVIDVGAHIGEYSLIAARLTGPSGRVVAVEPQLECADVIEKNFAANHVGWARVWRCALDSRNAKVQFYIDPQSRGGCIIRGTNPTPGVTVDSLTLVELLRRVQVEMPHLIKLDAAGNEFAIVRSAEELFRRDNAPVLIAKFYDRESMRSRYGEETGDLRELLIAWGYRLHGEARGYGPSVLALPPRMNART
jgi:FkbM family methyltransferase